jgi:hypothetical protein
MAFTDHHRLVPLKRLQELNEHFKPFCIWGGIEMTTFEGEDLLVLGVHDTALEKVGWHYAELYGFVRERGGFMALAHPFRYRDTINIDLDEYPPDAIELHSLNTPYDKKNMIMNIMERLDCPGLYTSDAHHVDAVGFYHVKLDDIPVNDTELVSLLQAGAFCGAELQEQVLAYA